MPPQTLTPDPGTLGLHAPTLGPWFTADRIRIGAVEPDLAAPLTWAGGPEGDPEGGTGPADGEAWFLPPAGGTFTLRRVGSRHPGPLAELRLPDGRPAFPPVPGGATGAAGPVGRLVLVHRLLPQVEARLARLFRRLPPAGGVALPDGASEEPRRPVPRWFVLDFRSGPLSFEGDLRAALEALVERFPSDAFFPAWVELAGAGPEDRLAARLRYLGLTPEQAGDGGGPVTGADNGPRAMERLARPFPARRILSGSGDDPLPPAPADTPHPSRLVRLRAEGSGDPLPHLRVFDAEGWPLDPGAVAAWLGWLVRPGAGGIPNLHVEEGAGGGGGGGASPTDLPRRIARSTDDGRGLVIRLRGPGGGAPPGAVLARTTVTGAEGLGEPVADAPPAEDAEGADPSPRARLLWRRAGPPVAAEGEDPPSAGEVVLGFSAPPTAPAPEDPASPASAPPDAAPVPRLGLLPVGRLGSTLALAGTPAPAAAPPPTGAEGSASADPGPDGAIGGTIDAPGLVRDQVEVAVVCLERELTGQPRVPPAGISAGTEASDPRVRGALDQHRPSTRTRVGPVARDAFLFTREEAAEAIVALLAPLEGEAEDPPSGPGGSPEHLAPRTHLVAPTLDRRWGPIPDPWAPPGDGLPDVDPPAGPPPAEGWSLHGLGGGGEADGGVIRGQRVLLRIAPGWVPPGAWVRVWGQQMDLRLGVRMRTDGGGGRAERDGEDAGAVHLVLTLADGVVEPSVPLGFEVMVATRRGARFLADLRAPRPVPVEAPAVALEEAAGPVVICEAGVRVAAPPLPGGVVPSGSTVVALGTPPRLVAPASIPSEAWFGPTLGQVLVPAPGPGHRIRVTEPAFAATPTGDLPGEEAGAPAAPGGAQLLQHRRGFPHVLVAGAPVLSMERLELAAVRRRAGGPGAGGGAVGAPLPEAGSEAAGARLLEGVVTGGPALARYHERLPHRWAHPLAPAAAEIHGVGVRLRGPGARGLREYLAERTTPHTLALVAEACRGGAPEPLSEPPPADSEGGATPPEEVAGRVGGDRLWAAVLRTVAPGVESEVGLATLGTHAYPFSERWPELRAWLEARLQDLVEGAGAGSIPGLPAPGAFLDQLLAGAGLDDATEARIQRALDRRMRGAIHGYREGATALFAAVDRAESLVYLETPFLCDLALAGGAGAAAGAEGGGGAGPDGGPARRSLVDALLARMDQRPALRVVLCLPQRPGPGLPRPLERVRHDLVRRVLRRMRGVEGAGGWRRPRGDRVAVFTPNAGPARTLFMATTTMVVDDAWALVGTTHPWRRGLTFDGSLAVSLTDERLRGGRPAEIAALRRRLVADRLGVSPAAIPGDPVGLVQAIRILTARGGGDRLLQNLPHQPEHEPVAAEEAEGAAPGGAEGSPSLEGREHDLWNPEGTPERLADVATWLGDLLLPRHAPEIRGVPPSLP